MKPLPLLLILLLLTSPLPAAQKILTLATTTSTENTGLLDEINPVFEKKYRTKVKVIALGTGAAIKCAEEGNADVILVHAREREDKFVAEGYGLNRMDVMYNDFIIIGPASDPAKILDETNAIDALIKIHDTGSTFVSRGDDSGTHIKEQALWKETKLPLHTVSSEITQKGKNRTVSYMKPEGNWYFSIGQGMGNTINFAFEKQGYTLTDRGTYLAYKNKVDLVILNERDEQLHNPYGIIAVNPVKHPHVKFHLAMKYIVWITSPETQKLIKNFKIEGQSLFFPVLVKSVPNTAK